MKEDLLRLYSKSHSDNFSNFLVVISVFLFARLFFYGFFALSGPGAVLFFTFLLVVSSAFFVAEYHLLKEIGGRKKLTPNFAKNSIIRIATYKAGYLVPALIILFWPIHAHYVFELLVGFGFVCVALVIYVSVSAMFLQLFLWEAFILITTTLVVVLINFHVQETRYVGLFMALFFVFIVNTGLKFNEFASELVRRRYALEKAVAKSEFAVRAKSEFLAVISHEIRTPMNGILGMIDFLRETNLSKEQEECINTITSCSGALMNTLNDVLDVSKIEAGKFTIEKIRFDLHSMLGDVAKIIDTVAMQKGLDFAFECDPALPIHVKGDPNRLQQVVINLLNNAVKFTDRGSVTLKALYKHDPQKMIRIEIRDTGIGISAEQQQKLFENFSQVDSTITRKYGGTGLGLSISKQLVSLMEGQIGVTSQPGRGSTFWFEIPLIEPFGTDWEEKEEIIGDVRNLKFLLADDNHINQMVVTRMLTNMGNKVEVVNNGQKAVNAAKSGNFDMILMDLHMPVLDGIGATKAIKAQGGKAAAIPIIALTANLMEEHLKACFDAGMVGYIGKPIDKKLFIRTILKHLPTHLQPQAETIMEKPRAEAAQLPPSSMIEKVNSIREEFGKEFSSYFLDENMKEAEKILGNLSQAVALSNFSRISSNAHDMVSVAGNVGMDNVSNMARKIEHLADDGKAQEIMEIYGTLVREFTMEINKLRDHLQT